MKPTFEVHAVFVMEQMEMNLMELKQSGNFENDFYVELRDFFVGYLKEAENELVHGDIKPRVALKNFIVDCK